MRAPDLLPDLDVAFRSLDGGQASLLLLAPVSRGEEVDPVTDVRNLGGEVSQLHSLLEGIGFGVEAERRGGGGFGLGL